MKKDISEADNVVISGSLTDWGDKWISLFTLAVRLVTDTETRIAGLKVKHDERQKLLLCRYYMEQVIRQKNII